MATILENKRKELDTRIKWLQEEIDQLQAKMSP